MSESDPSYEELKRRVTELEGLLAERTHDPGAAREELYRQLFEHMLHEVHVWELVRDDGRNIKTWRLVDANPAALASWGRRLSDVVGKTTNEIFGGFDATELFMPVVKKIFDEGKPHTWEHHFPATGQFLHMVSEPFGEYFISTGLDITHLRRAEERLKDTVLKLRQAIEAGNVGLWDWDIVTDKVRYSPEWKEQFGYADDEIGDDVEEWKSRLHPDDKEATLRKVTHAISTGKKRHEAMFRLRRKDGSYRWILANSSTVTTDAGKPIRMLGAHIDITERKLLESHVEKSQRLEAVGTLAGGIAHDFNNLLAAILLNTSMARSELPPQSDAHELLQEAEQALNRAKSLTHQLLTFSKGGEPVTAVASVEKLVQEAARLMTRGSNCNCELSIAQDLSFAEIDVGQVCQVFNNIVINACQAMPSGGVIQIRAYNVSVDENDARALASGDYVAVSITDQGVGIPDRYLSKVFDPFFTTKQAGSGLGLSTAHSILHRHGGCITAESEEEGRGTTIHVYLPASLRTTVADDEQRAVPGKGNILVMDDEQLLRSALSNMLTTLGYTVDVAEDGAAAICLTAAMTTPLATSSHV